MRLGTVVSNMLLYATNEYNRSCRDDSGKSDVGIASCITLQYPPQLLLDQMEIFKETRDLKDKLKVGVFLELIECGLLQRFCSCGDVFLFHMP